MRAGFFFALFTFLWFSSSALGLTCNGHIVNGYNSTDYGYKKLQEMAVTFEDCGAFIPNAMCNSVFLNGEKKTAYWGEGKFMFFRPGVSFTAKTGFLFFKMREVRLTANPNEDERWFNGICK